MPDIDPPVLLTMTSTVVSAPGEVVQPEPVTSRPSWRIDEMNQPSGSSIARKKYEPSDAVSLNSPAGDNRPIGGYNGSTSFDVSEKLIFETSSLSLSVAPTSAFARITTDPAGRTATVTFVRSSDPTSSGTRTHSGL